MAKPSEQAQINFIADRLRKGQERKDILQEFTKVYKVSVKTFDTRLKHATKAVQAEQKRIQEQAEGNVAKKVEELESKLMTPIDRQLNLSIQAQDILDKLSGKKKFTFKMGNKIMQSHNGDIYMCPIETQLDMAEKFKVLVSELNKMGGDYAPSKTDITSGGDSIKSILIDRASNSKRK